MFWKIEGNGGFSPQTFTNDIFSDEDYKFLRRFYPETHSKLHKTCMSTGIKAEVEDGVLSLEFNVAGVEKDQLSVKREGKNLMINKITEDTGEQLYQYPVNSYTDISAKYKAGMLYVTCKKEIDSTQITIE